MNVRPLNYGWREFYDHMIDLTAHSFSARAIARRASATSGWRPKLLNTVRAASSERIERLRYHRTIRGLLDTDRSVEAFMGGETGENPAFYAERIRRELGPLYQHLPPGAMMHDPNAFLHATTAAAREVAPDAVGVPAAG